jgi:glutamate/tyrosine decarboxylase-like PLP-dependent enzyme
VTKPLWTDSDAYIFSRPNSPAVCTREEKEKEEEQQAAAVLLELGERNINVPQRPRRNELAGQQKVALASSRRVGQACSKRKLAMEDTASCWAALPSKRSRRPSPWLRSDEWDLTMDK